MIARKKGQKSNKKNKNKSKTNNKIKKYYFRNSESSTDKK